ncbi:MAG: hypothetical protein ABI665_02950 [Vicinamibacterales bacterium]
MGTLNQHCETPSLALVTESVDALAVLKKAKGRVKRWLRQRLCFAISGGHELYRSHTDTKIYQECLLCGFETPGWTIDRRDRRMHLVSNRTSSAASR